MRKEKDSLMKGNNHENNVLSNRRMVTFVPLPIQNIPKEYALKSLGSNLE